MLFERRTLQEKLGMKEFGPDQLDIIIYKTANQRETVHPVFFMRLVC